MPRYRVTLPRVEYQSATIEVEAKNEDDAKEVAKEEITSDDYETNNANEDVQSVEEVEDE